MEKYTILLFCTQYKSSDSMTDIKCYACGDSKLKFIASNNLHNSSDTLNTTDQTSYTKVKELTILTCKVKGRIRVKFTLATNNTNKIATGRIYVGAVATGAEQTTISTSGVEFSQDITVTSSNTLIQIYAKVASGGLAAVTNFRIYCDATCLSCGYEDSMLQKHTW